MQAFDSLSRDIQQYIYDKGWPSLTRIQNAAIKQVANTDHNLILSAPTASGKTEAAFIPALNSVEDWDTGLKVLYISPLKALINDQFQRISELSAYLDIPITRWHGEVSQAQKKKVVNQPKGILLITPESIEGMLVNRPGAAAFLTPRSVIKDYIEILSLQRQNSDHSFAQILADRFGRKPSVVAKDADDHDEIEVY